MAIEREKPLPPVCLQTARRSVGVAWPVASFPAAKVGLQPCMQSSLGVKPGDGVTVCPLTGPLMQAEEVLLSPRHKDETLETEEFKNYFLRSLEGRVMLPGSQLSLSFYGRACSLRVEAVLGEDGILLQGPASAPGPDAEDTAPGEPSLLGSTSADLSLQLSLLSVEAEQDARPRPHAASTPLRHPAREPLSPVSPPLRPAPLLPSTPLSPVSHAPHQSPLTPEAPPPAPPPGSWQSSDTFYCVSLATAVRLRDRRGRSHAPGEEGPGQGGRDQAPGANKVTYSMIGGLSSQLEVIRESIELPLTRPELFSNYGIPAPRGVLLYGPSGTGKTMIGRAIANEIGAHMTVINGPEIISKCDACPPGSDPALQVVTPTLQGVLSRHGRLPSCVSSGSTERRSEAETDIHWALAEEAHAGQVLVLGATNRPHALDPALRRPGRFDRELEVGVPSASDRLDILQKLLATVPCDVTGPALARLSDSAHGYVGADLAAVCKEADQLKEA
ncbi:hypothetical protein CRUP_016362 [Coryphaenoides rupestris]|nr:hypothetical protein CRUP_016362 [Coryphaenoides rupestris]